jgi:hypothetical protein
MIPMNHSKQMLTLKVDISSSILILHYEETVLMYVMLQKQTENKGKKGSVLLGEGRFFC